MDQWVKIAGQFGIPVALLMLLAYFILRHVWPFVTRQIQDAQTQRAAEIEKFDNTIRKRDGLMVQQWQEHLKALDAITGEIRGLREDIQTNYPQRTTRRRK